MEISKEYQEILDMQKNAPVNGDIRELIGIYINQGKEACLSRLNAIIQEKKLALWEVVVLQGWLREILINNGIIIK